MRKCITAIAVLSVAWSGCGGSEEVANSDTPRTVMSADHGRTYAVLGEEAVRLGGAEGAGPFLFSRISGLLVDGEDQVWVADGASGELRVFDRNGTHIRTVGGEGEGPGEFRAVQLLGVHDGRVVAGDRATRRLTYFDPSGDLVGTVSIPAGDGSPSYLAISETGTLLGTSAVQLNVGEVSPGQILSDSARFVTWEPVTEEPIVVGRAPSATFLWDGTGMKAVPFTANPGAVIDGGTVHLTSGTEFRIRVMSRGEGLGSYGVQRAARPTAGLEGDYRDFYSQNFSGQQLTEFLQMLETDAVPESAPAYSRLMLRSNGEIWARQYTVNPLSPGLWDVFSPEREFLGSVRTPKMFRVLAIEEDGIWGISFDELYVEYLSRYSIGQ